MGDSLAKYYEKDMPSLLVHRTYTTPTEFDTTEKILTITLGDKITDIFIFGKPIRSSNDIRSQIIMDTSDLVLNGLISYSYVGDSISTTLLKMVASGVMQDYQLDEYTYTDSMSYVSTKISTIPGYPLKYAFRDVYYPLDSTHNKRHNNFTFIDLGNGHSYWHERFREIEFYDFKDSIYDKSIKFSLSKIDTTWKTIEFSKNRDTSITTITQQVDTCQKIIIERVINTYNNKGNITSIKSELRNDRESPLIYYAFEEFKYFDDDSIIYKRSLYDTTSKAFVLSKKESHLLHSNGRYRNIFYYENIGNSLELVGEDIFTYASNITEIEGLKKYEHNYKIHKTIFPEEIRLSINKIIPDAFGVLYNMAGREIKTLNSDIVGNKSIFVIDPQRIASGKYIFILNTKSQLLTVPLIINK